MDYISHQRRLMPMLANCYAYRLMGHYLLDLYKSTHTHHRAHTTARTMADVTLA